ncbi:MAG TPA: response regulator [Ktedonobacteraceae bacterium]
MNLPRVLVVDDSPSACLFITTVLRQRGYEVDVALSGREGFAKIMTFRPHCVILDVLLPDTTGYALCRHLRQSSLTQRLPLILISGKKAPLDISYGLRQGADRYLSKPFTAEMLAQNVWEIIPISLRALTNPVLPAVQLPAIPAQPAIPLAQFKLIPRRVLSQDAMRTSNPFMSAPVVEDSQARLLLSKIDGKRTVTRLATETGLEVENVIKALRVLLKADCIQLYNAEGQRVEEEL